ncbi:MAG: hypothetical protein MUF36_05065 [Bacteroidales bacterium]|jgi:hypothetical protein|nr:hypothetical protein [Bacteroidales bacterium]
MKKLLIFSLATLVLITAAMNAYGQQRDIKAILKRDIVKTENGMYSIQEYGTATAFDKEFNTREFQVSVNAKAPVSILSKDNFIRFYGALSTSIFTTYFSQEGLKAPDDFNILLKDKPGEPVDLTVEIVMSESGIDYTISFHGGRSQMHLHWLTQLYQEVER